MLRMREAVALFGSARMARIRSTLALLVFAIILSPQLAAAGPGIPACCICSECPARASACTGPLIECGDVFCQTFGCGEPLTGTDSQCAALPPCAVTEAAPTTSARTMLMLAAGLAGFGAYRLARRRRG